MQTFKRRECIRQSSTMRALNGLIFMAQCGKVGQSKTLIVKFAGSGTIGRIMAITTTFLNRENLKPSTGELGCGLALPMASNRLTFSHYLFTPSQSSTDSQIRNWCLQ